MPNCPWQSWDISDLDGDGSTVMVTATRMRMIWQMRGQHLSTTVTGLIDDYGPHDALAAGDAPSWGNDATASKELRLRQLDSDTTGWHCQRRQSWAGCGAHRLHMATPLASAAVERHDGQRTAVLVHPPTNEIDNDGDGCRCTLDAGG